MSENDMIDYPRLTMYQTVDNYANIHPKQTPKRRHNNETDLVRNSIRYA